MTHKLFIKVIQFKPKQER